MRGWDPMQLEHERHVLGGGTVVLTRPLTANDIVVVRAYLPMGPLWESEDEAGLSRLVQGVLPRGTGGRSNRELQEALAGLGADLDAGTGTELGHVSLRATSAMWERAIDLYLETLTEPAFDPGEVETEIEKTVGEIEAREDVLMARAMDLFRETFYEGHPYHKSVLGRRETVRGFDADAVAAGWRRFYRPVPPVVVAVGRFEPDRLVRRIETAFGNTSLARPEERPPPPEGRSGTRVLEIDREAAYLVHGRPAPSYGDPDYPVARLIDAMLGGSMDSRLFLELREKRSLAYQVSSMYHDQPEGSFLAGYIVTDPSRAEEAARGLEREFRRLVDEAAPAEEIERARRYLRGTYRIGAETNAAQATRLGRYEAFGLGRDFGVRWLAALETVGPEEVRATARRWLDGPPTRTAVVPPGAMSEGVYEVASDSRAVR